MKKRLGLIIHLYGGTLVFFYLLMIGISAFHFHHSIPLFEKKETFYKEWQMPLNSSDSLYTPGVIEKINSQIGIFGNATWWTQFTDSIGTFHYEVTRPGKKYKLIIPKKKDVIKVTEYNTGLGYIFVSLHSLSIGLPKSRMTQIWKVFSFIMALISFAVLTISFYLWYQRAFKKKLQWLFVGIICVLSILYILYIWLVG